MTTNIPNRIKQPPQCCTFCGKSYVKKTNLNNHVVLCELLHKSSKKTTVEDDEEIPSQKKMYQIILEIGKKLNGLDEKVDEINKWVIKKKKKINVIEWLNTHATPEITFDNLSNKITILEDDIKSLFDSNFIDVLNQIFARTIYNISENEYPIFAFVQKSNIFYIYENEDAGWTELSREKLVKFLDKIYMKISRAFSEWKKNNKTKMQDDENFQLQCDKTSVKMYSVDVKNEITLGKIRNCMYSRMKTDMKALVEYEFEF
jgi:hypothetical protein